MGVKDICVGGVVRDGRANPYRSPRRHHQPSTSDLECAEILVAEPALFEDCPLRLIPTMREYGLIV